MIRARIIAIVLLLAAGAVEAGDKPWGFERDPGSCMMATYSQLRHDKTRTVGAAIFYNYDPNDTRMAPEGVAPQKQYVFLWTWKGQLDEDQPAILDGPGIDNLRLTMSSQTWLERMQIFLLDDAAAESFFGGMQAGDTYEVGVHTAEGPDSVRLYTQNFFEAYIRYMGCLEEHRDAHG